MQWHGGRARQAGRFVLVGLLVVALTACIKLDMDMTVSSDDTISGTMIFAVQKSLADLAGEDLFSEAPVDEGMEGVTAQPWEDDQFRGQHYTIAAMTLEEFNAEGSDFTIERDGDVFRLSGVLDMAADTGGDTGDLDMDPSAFMGGAQIRIRVTFPGEVIETNGQVDGNTVTWEPSLGETQELSAVANVEGGAGSGWMMWLLIGLGVLVLAGVAVLLLRRRDTGLIPATPDAVANMPPPDVPMTPPAGASDTDAASSPPETGPPSANSPSHPVAPSPSVAPGHPSPPPAAPVDSDEPTGPPPPPA